MHQEGGFNDRDISEYGLAVGILHYYDKKYQTQDGTSANPDFKECYGLLDCAYHYASGFVTSLLE